MPDLFDCRLLKIRLNQIITTLIIFVLAGCASKPQPSKLPDNLINSTVTESAIQTENELNSAQHTPQDRYEYAIKLLHLSAEQRTPAKLALPTLGDKLDFFINYDLDSDFRPIPATLQQLSEHAAWWVADNANVSDADLSAAVNNFENITFKINRLVYGIEEQPGIDNDDRIHFLLVDIPEWEGYYGYFSTINTFPKGMQIYSNEKDMMVINVGGAPMDSLNFAGELGHEFAHLIQWSRDANEDLWMNEALAELSAFLVVSPPVGSTMDEGNQQVFADMPFVQLTARQEVVETEDDEYAVYAHYGGEKLFTIYLLDRFGPQFMKDLIANQEAGVRSLDQELGKLSPSLTFDQVYAEWIMANLLNTPDHSQGRFGYNEVNTLLPYIIPISQFSGEVLPGYMAPYSTFYYEFNADENLTIDFKGAPLARLTAADPYDGEYSWYSNRGDETSFTLTRSFDLSKVKSATLNYSIWYELEKDFDYAYVLASGDNGASWKVLPTKYGMVENLSDEAYGIGYTGESSKWLKESLDLSEYAGGQALIRFIVNTDLATNRDGVMLDNIEIPELDYFDGAETDQGGWEAQGFIRSANIVPVDWIVWIIKINLDPSVEDEVIRVQLDELQSAKIVIEGFSKDFDFASMVVSPTAPTTTMSIDYEFTLTGK